MIDLTSLEKEVLSNLQSARDNGFPLSHLTPAEIAEDMLHCTSLIDDYGIDPDALQTIVAAIVLRNRLHVNHDNQSVSLTV